MRFRKITIEDKEEVLQMMEEFYHSDAVDHLVDTKVHTLTFEELMSESNYLEGFVFMIDGKRGGYSILSKQFAVEVGGLTLWIEDLYIREAFRGLGLAKEFLHWVKDNYSVPRLRLEVTPTNEKAKALYRTLGFVKLDYEQMIFE